ncbi:hypothetical protein VFPPC_10538 [Pochonia chlamydosporia 170]|uniref:Uncharacterized protein n=1 Tax=Pochonia chlamydosporia 170 TaxID=1380566 RepID=A0A179F227_METCM|nr:hypothetical protein VFPPC_10538 [Pochonia chlamydosporia 170]OAQ59482.1 hypothetical protein VFPPC_10538 [Pochonia chlamydosporia 170]
MDEHTVKKRRIYDSLAHNVAYPIPSAQNLTPPKEKVTNLPRTSLAISRRPNSPLMRFCIQVTKFTTDAPCTCTVVALQFRRGAHSREVLSLRTQGDKFTSHGFTNSRRKFTYRATWERSPLRTQGDKFTSHGFATQGDIITYRAALLNYSYIAQGSKEERRVLEPLEGVRTLYVNAMLYPNHSLSCFLPPS